MQRSRALGHALLERIVELAQFEGQPLRLREQGFGAHCRLDRIEDGANTSCELVEEGKVDVGEPVHRSELDDRFGFALEENREHNDTHALCFTQTRGDGNEFGRNVVE